jgi:tRNA-specific 2-thiouridylase
LLKKETGFGCCGSTRDIDDARAVCARLGVPHFVMDFAETFQANIMGPFLDSYLAGETPNPCISCNRFVKFDALLKKALSLGADVVATGHYARIEESDGRYRLKRAVDVNKDQSYVLYHLGQRELPRLLFPLGHLTKPEVRDLARTRDLPTARKAESMEICFVPGADTAGFVKCEADRREKTARTLSPGEIRDAAGRLLGIHRGVAFYTRGQREGLGLALGRPFYVVDLDAASNTVVVGEDRDTHADRFQVRGVSWTAGAPPAESFEALVQIRSRHAPVPARVIVDGDRAVVESCAPLRAPAPGQAAVFYGEDEVLGGGEIDSVLAAGKAGAGA